MGVPKFFRWCAERYPSVITPFRDAPPPVDNLYLDMNGIIHNCTHPNDIDATLKAPTEKEMISAMFTYLEKLFNAIQPRKHFFLAVDGVAPRAKMNQQRQRRYRSGYEMMVAREEALSRGDDVPDESDVFDSNCITPGTPFMVRVSEAFEYFICMKLSTDVAWQNCEIIFSGHDCPGEGEHKVMEFIRSRKMQPGYEPNETHCLYGLDADLIMLALATHEPHFILLREVVTFGGGSRKEREQEEEALAKGLVVDKSYQKAEEFVLFHINVLREYLERDVQQHLSAVGAVSKFDLEKVIDDFIFMCFFIGNDFLPSIPTIGINDGSLMTMITLYTRHILSKGMYLTDAGVVNWRVAELWLAQLGELEFETIKARETQEEEYQRMRKKRDPSHEVPSTVGMPTTSIGEYKEKYYLNKHGFKKGWDPNGEDMQKLKLHFVEGLSWVIAYYYQGVPSWKWFFPHFYAPMASDLVNLPAVAAKIKFDLGKPFFPHQQLLAVLPPMSYRSIPDAYWPLLRSKTSPLAKYFPDHIQIDREGTRAPWEGIVLIPFIDEDTLLAAYNSVQNRVSEGDAHNNRLGPPIRFRHDIKMDPYVLHNDMFGDLVNLCVQRQVYQLPTCTRFVPALCDNVFIKGKQLEGFSSLQSKDHLLSTTCEMGAVSLLGSLSKRESLMLNLRNFTNAATARDAATLLGKEVLVGFPHYKRARVSSVSDLRTTIRVVYNSEGGFTGNETREKTRDEATAFLKEAETHKKYMKSKLGICVEDIQLLIYVHRFSGMRLSRRGRIVRQFSKTETCYPMALLCPLDEIHMQEDSRYVERDRSESDSQVGTSCIYVGPEPKTKSSSAQIYGSSGFIVNTVSSNTNDEHVAVCLTVFHAPQHIPKQLTQYASTQYWSAQHEVALTLNISPRTLSMICSSLETSPQFGSREVGLCMKFSRRSLTRVGYAKLVRTYVNPWHATTGDIFSRMELDVEADGHHLERVDKTDLAARAAANKNASGIWYLSREAVNLLRRYIAAFPPLMKYLETGGMNSRYLEPQNILTDIWRDKDVDDVLQEIESFIEDSGIHQVPMVEAEDDCFTNDHISLLEEELDNPLSRPQKEVAVKKVNRRSLYFPVTRSAGGHIVPVTLPQEQTFRLGARVVNCRPNGSTPFGACGTIVRLLASGREAEVVYDDPFTGGSTLGGRLKKSRASINKLSALLVTSTGAGEGPSPPSDSVSNVLSSLSKKRDEKQTSTGKSSTVTPGNQSNPRSGKESGKSLTPSQRPTPAAATAHIITPSPTTSLNISEERPKGGINVGDLVRKLPTTSGVASPAQTPAEQTNLHVTQSRGNIPLIPPKSSRKQGSPSSGGGTAGRSNEHTTSAAPATHDALSAAIPVEHLSHKTRLTPENAGSAFRQVLATLQQQALHDAQQDGTA